MQLSGIFKNGYGFIAKMVMQDRNLHVTAKALYAYFCSFSGKGDDIFPSRSKICYDLQISSDTFSKYLKSLVDGGYIGVRQVKKNGKFSHNVYTFFTEPQPKLPCPKISDTENIVHGNLDTNNNKGFNKNSNLIITGSKEKETKKEKPTVEVNFDAFVQIYRDICIGFPGIRSITAQRKKAIKKFLEEHTVEEFKEICQKAIASDFLTGKSTGFKADFDFLIKPDKAIKTLEGTYDNSPAQQQKQQKQQRANQFANFEQRNWDFEKLEAAQEAENEREYQKTIQAKLNKDIGFAVADGVTGNFKPQQGNSLADMMRKASGVKLKDTNATESGFF